MLGVFNPETENLDKEIEIFFLPGVMLCFIFAAWVQQSPLPLRPRAHAM